ERVTRTRVRLPEVRAALPRRDRRRPVPRRARRRLPGRVQHRATARGDRLEPAPGGAPGPGRPADPQLSRDPKPASSLTRDTGAGRLVVGDLLLEPAQCLGLGPADGFDLAGAAVEVAEPDDGDLPAAVGLLVVRVAVGADRGARSCH